MCNSFQLTSSSNDESLSWLLAHREDIIAGDSELSGAGNVWVSGSPSASDHNELSVEDAFGFVLQDCNNVVGVLEVAQTVDVLDLLVAQVDTSDPVHGLDVVLN